MGEKKNKKELIFRSFVRERRERKRSRDVKVIGVRLWGPRRREKEKETLKC